MDYEEVGSRSVANPFIQIEADYEFDHEQSRDHTYEFDGPSSSGSKKDNEYTYSEIGPYEEMVRSSLT